MATRLAGKTDIIRKNIQRVKSALKMRISNWDDMKEQREEEEDEQEQQQQHRSGIVFRRGSADVSFVEMGTEKEIRVAEATREEDIATEDEEEEVPAEDPACKVREMVMQEQAKN